MSPFIIFLSIVIVLVAVTTRLLERIQAPGASIGQSVKTPQEKPLKYARANSFGQESKGVMQVRGTGTLSLTHSALRFTLLIPHREWNIPLPNIIRIESPKSHLYKSQGVPLLKVVYHNESGQEDSIAWRVSALQEWIDAINAQRNRTLS